MIGLLLWLLAIVIFDMILYYPIICVDSRIYAQYRNPSFCDRVLVSNSEHHRTIHMRSMAYDSIYTGIIALSDHDLVYQVIQISNTDPFKDNISKMMLIITWNFGDSVGNIESYEQLLRDIENSLSRHRISLVHDIDILFFSFQEAVSTQFTTLINNIQTKIRGMYHVQTVNAGDSIDIHFGCIQSQYAYKVYGLLFIKYDHNIRYTIFGKSRKLTIARPVLCFVSKSAAFTSTIHFGDAFSLIFIAAHFPIDLKKTSNHDLGVKKRIKALQDVYNMVGGDRNIVLVLAGDLNFRQNITYNQNQNGHFISYGDQLTNVLNKQPRWQELQQPQFAATCKRGIYVN
eukprot:116776_1